MDAVGTGNATRGIGGVDDAKLVLGDGIGRADFGTDRVLAMHAKLHRGLRAEEAVDVIDLDHRFVAVGFTLGAGHLTGVAADAALRIEEELLIKSKPAGAHGLA